MSITMFYFYFTEFDEHEQRKVEISPIRPFPWQNVFFFGLKIEESDEKQNGSKDLIYRPLMLILFFRHYPNIPVEKIYLATNMKYFF